MNRFAFVPKEIFDENNATQYLPIKKNIQRRAKVICQHFDYYGVVGLADCRNDATDRTNRLFALIKASESNSDSNILAHVEGRQLFVVAVKEAKLLLANIWEVDKNEDIAYFILSVAEHSNLDIESIKVKLSSPENDTLMVLLNKYVETETFKFVC